MNKVISFSINKTDEEVFEAARVAYNDFDDIDEIEEIRTRKDPYAEGRSELIEKCLKGIIKNDDVNVIGYAIGYEQIRRMAKCSRETNFLRDDEIQQGFTTGITYATYSSSRSRQENEIDKAIERLDHGGVIAEFEEFYDVVAVEHGVNLRTIIKKALLTAHRSYVNRIRLLMKEYGKEELIETILRSEELLYKLGLKGDPDDSSLVWKVGC